MSYRPPNQRTPTVFPADPFDPAADAETLRAAMKGFGTDEKALIDVLARRTNEQRLEIANQFKTMYGKDLLDDLQSETGGRLEDLLLAIMTPLPQLYAKQLHDALAGLGTDEEILVEIFCGMTNSQIEIIRAVYESEYGSSLEGDLKSDTSGSFRRLMISLCNCGRSESMITDVGEASEDAQRLVEAGENQWGTDESVFNMIMCQRSYAQLQLVFQEYEKLACQDIEETIKGEFSGNSEEAFLGLVRGIKNRPLFFAKCLNEAIAGIGTNDSRLVRIVSTRCEIDMGDIKEAYAAAFEESLADAISGDTSGDYRQCLLALIGEC